MKQKVIGITVCVKPGQIIQSADEYLYLRREYLQAVRSAGGQPIMLGPDISPETAARICDGVVMTGGYDIPADLYGEPTHESTDISEARERVEWERALIDACDAAGTSILGVCYGMQLMNVHYGGSLYQDIPSQVPSAGRHDPATDINDHVVTFNQDFLGFQAGESTASAPRHHQAVRDVADGWEVIATTNDGVIEAMRGGNHYGVQWHPESDHTAATIYSTFIEQCVRENESVFTQVFDQEALVVESATLV